MGEFNKDPNQSGFGKEEKGGKPAFGQFEKGQEGQEEFGQKKGEDTGQDKSQAGQQFAEEKAPAGQEKPGEFGETKGSQQQYAEKPQQRQQGDEDLGDDSIDNQNLK